MPQPRSEALQLVAYALARCGTPTDRPKQMRPPPWLGVTAWGEAYDLFYDALSEGREPKSFRNTLKNARDAFDAHLPNGRTGWVDYKDGGRPWRQDRQVRAILDHWQSRDESELTAAVLGLLAGARADDDEDQESEEGEARTEGGRKVWQSARYERKAANRRNAIALHGVTCMGCQFNFSEAYGETGRDYIEVHHVMPLAQQGVRETDPATDLVVLCANCHRIVHRRRGLCLTLAGLRQIVDDGRGARGLAALWSSADYGSSADDGSGPASIGSGSEM